MKSSKKLIMKQIFTLHIMYLNQYQISIRILRFMRVFWEITLAKAYLVRRYFTFFNYLAMLLIDFTKYDLIISSSSGPAKSIRFRKDAKHICYINTPHWEDLGIKNSPVLIKNLKAISSKVRILVCTKTDKITSKFENHPITN